jgi:hypothetical protein
VDVLGSLSVRVLVVATAVVAAVGMVDALRGGSADLVAVFALVALLQLVVLAGLQLGRRPVPLRPDLSAWLEQRSVVTGEPPELIADRCISEYRSALGSEE